MIIEASAELETLPEEQTRLLDLLEVFRNYTERKDFYTPAKIIAKQVSNLEAILKKLTAVSNPTENSN